MTLGRAMKVRVRTGMFNADKLEVIHGGYFASDSCAGQYSYLSSYGTSDSFEESDCTEDLWCTTADSNTCVGVSYVALLGFYQEKA